MQQSSGWEETQINILQAMYYTYLAQIEIALCSFCFHSHKAGINPVTKLLLDVKMERVSGERVQRAECDFFGKPASLFYYLVMLLCKMTECSHYMHFSPEPTLL